MRYRVLGPIEVRDGAHSVALGGYRQRLLLALLLCRRGEALSTDWLVDAVWGEHPPRTARKTLQVYVSRLRGVLGENTISTGPGTYRINIGGADRDEADLDVDAFTAAADRGHRLLATDANEALLALSGALALWRGPPFGEMADHPGLRDEAQRLRERRMVAVEDRVDAEQRLGHSPAAVADLEALVAEHPGRARLRAALMLGLYRSGREAEALALFDEARRTLADELGADPDPVLADLHARMLRRDDTLLPTPAGAAEPPSPTPTRNPYKGLHSFESADAGDFFGRAALTDALESAVHERSLVVVVGASGSGKSSAVRAGLVPRLSARSSPWAVVTMTPGAHPFERLREAAATAGATDVAWRTDDLDVLRTMQALLRPPFEQVLLVVDQAEELLTQSARQAAGRFVANLMAVADDPAASCTVLATVRADFTDRLLADTMLAPAIGDALVTVVPLDPAEISDAATGPAHLVGLAVEPELVAELVADMTDQPGALPLFEYALTEMCRNHVGPVLTRAEYRDLGGLRGALARRAEQTYQALEPAEQSAARGALLRLVAVTEAGAAVRQRRTRAAIESLDPHAGTALDAFDRARLLTFDRDPVTAEATVEVAHESLIAAWPRMAAWVEDSRDDLRLARGLDAQVAEWESAGRQQDYLLGGSHLAAYDEWPRTPAVSPTPAERAYLSSSRAERERRTAIDRRAARRLRALVAATTAVALVASLLAVLAVQRGSQAQAAADRARARDLAAASSAVLDHDSDLAILLASHAVRLSAGRVPQAISALHTAVAADRLVLSVAEGVDAALLPGGRVLVGGEQPRVIDLASGQVVARLGDDPASLVAASANGSTVATSVPGGYVTWDLAGPTRLAEHSLTRLRLDSLLWDLAVSDDGALAASQSPPQAGGLTVAGTSDPDIVARQLITGVKIDNRTGIRFDRSGTVVWRPDGASLMSLDVSSEAWDIALTGPGPIIMDVDEMADGSMLTAHNDGWVRRWTRDGDPLASVRVADRSLPTLAVDRLTDTVVVGDWSGTVHVFEPDGDGLRRVTSMTAGSSRILDVTVRDGLVSAADSQRQVRVWSVADTSELGRWPGGGPVAISPDGALLAVAREEQPGVSPTVTLRSLVDGEERARIPAPAGAIVAEGMDFSDDSSRLVVSYQFDLDTYEFNSGYKSIALVDTANGHVVHREPYNTPLLGDLDLAGPYLAVPVCSDGSPGMVIEVGESAGVPSTKPVRIAEGANACGQGIALASDLSRFAVLTDSPRAGAAISDLASGREEVFVAHEPGVRGSVRFSPDDRRLLTAGADGAARVWDVATGEPGAVLAGDSTAETAVWAGEEQVVSSHVDGTARVWDVASTRLLAEVGDAPVAPFIAVSPDGRRLATSADGQVLLWTLDPEELGELAQGHVSRSLTPAECDRYDIDDCPEPVAQGTFDPR